MRKFTIYLVTALIALVAASCKKDPMANFSLQFTQDSVEIEEGGDFNLKTILTVEPQGTKDTIKLNWSSSDEEIAVIEGNGWVVGKSMGETTVTVSAHGKSASVKVYVKELTVTDITMQPTYKDAAVNVPYALTGVELTPAGASPSRINWSCTSDKVTFSYNSEERMWYATAKEAGDYKISATVGSLEPKSAQLSVSVKKITRLNLSQTSIALLSEGTESRSATLTYNIEPEDASYKNVDWIVDDGGCIVFSNGVISSVEGKEGTATITLKHTAAATGDADISEKCTVTVTKSAPITSFDLSVSSKSVQSGSSFEISITNTKPASADASYVRWECDTPDALQLSTDKGVKCVVTAIAKENKNVKLKAIAPNGYEKVCDVTITIIPVESIKFNNETDLIAFSGKSYALPKATVTPSNATLAGDVEYSVSDAAVNVTVGSSDVSYAIPSGLSEVKTYNVTAKCGGKSASFVMYGVPTNYLNTVMLTSAYSEYGVFGMGGKELKPTQLIQEAHRTSTVASAVKMRYGSESGTATRAIVETSTYTVGSDYDSYKYDYNIHAEGSTSFNRSNIVFRLVLNDMTGSKQLSQTINAYFYNSLVKYTYQTTQKVDGKIKTVTGDITTSSTLELSIVRDASAQRIYRPAMTIYAEYYKDGSRSATGTYKAAYDAGTDYYDVKQDVTINMSVFSSSATKAQTGTHDFTIKFKK